MEKAMGKKCIVCKEGEIVEKIVQKFTSLSLPIIGPGSRDQFSDVSEGYFCKKCGLKYEHLDGVL